MKVYSFIFSILFVSSILSQDFWQQTNGPYGGSILSIVYKSNGNIFLGTGSGGGIYKSTNSGNTWSKLYHASYNVVISDLLIAENGDIYACANGIIRSTDDGNTWIQLGNMTGSEKCIGRNSLGHLFAGTNAGIFKSTNGGYNWTQVSSSYGYDVMNITISNSGDIYAALGGGWIFKSTNNGVTWTSLIVSLGGVDFTLDQSGYLLTANYNGIYKSTNNGLNWVNILSVHATCISIGLAGEYYAGGPGQIFKSTNNGANWFTVYSILPNSTQIEDIICVPGKVFAGMVSTGVIFSTNNGTNWSRINEGITNQSATELGYNGNGKIFSSSSTDGLFFTSNSGVSWIRTGLDYKNVTAIGFNGENNVFAGAQPHAESVYRSTDGGTTWEVANTGMSPSFVHGFESNNNIMFAATSLGLYKSTNNGALWISGGFANENVNAICKNLTGTLYTITDTAAYSSTNNGINWIRLNGFGQEIRNIAVSPVNNYVYLTHGNGSFYRSTNNGANWSLVSNNVYFYNMVCDLSGGIFGAGFNGVYRSTDFGSSWSELNSNSFNPELGDLIVDQAGYIYLGTRGSSVFRSEQPVLGITFQNSELPETFFLFQNYPNPFNPVTNIKFDLPKSGIVKITVYDLLGREITQLVNQQLQAGSYSAYWDASNYPSGVYLYKLQTDNFTETKKMVLLK